MRQTSPVDGHPARPIRIHGFVLISGMGWLLDLAIMTSLTAAGMPVFLANCVSAGIAVSFVFLIAQRRTFVHDGSWIIGKFAAYALYNAIAILLASLAIAALAHTVFEPILATFASVVSLVVDPNWRLALASILAKVAVTPLTLYANFLFMGWLLEGKASLR